jgi:hypothetical protein
LCAIELGRAQLGQPHRRMLRGVELQLKAALLAATQ